MAKRYSLVVLPHDMSEAFPTVLLGCFVSNIRESETVKWQDPCVFVLPHDDVALEIETSHSAATRPDAVFRLWPAAAHFWLCVFRLWPAAAHFVL